MSECVNSETPVHEVPVSNQYVWIPDQPRYGSQSNRRRATTIPTASFVMRTHLYVEDSHNLLKLIFGYVVLSHIFNHKVRKH